MESGLNRSEGKYGFYGRLREEFPSQVIIDLTEVCNLECSHCAHRHFKKSEYYSAASLDPDLCRKAVDEVRVHGQGITQYIRFTGEGEPLLHRQVFDILKYAAQNSGTAVTLTTNGTLLDDAKIENLLDTGIQVVDISIDAFHPETYAKIRVGGNLETTRRNVCRLLARAKERGGMTRVVVSYIEQLQNSGETSEFEAFWRGEGADYVVVRRLHSNSGALQAVADQMRQENVADRLRRPCMYPWERIVLNPRGYLAFCPADWTHGSTMRNYREVSIKETWQGDYYHALRQAHLDNEYSNHLFCGQCPDWVATRWPDDGRSYANMIEEFKDKE
jgi:MoaA/NifB/PqqE/SkfB family radical SAM enzyme